ncbi:MAG TPA: alpha-amylase family glycosyl hydrolase [Acidobacteriaceae bacterium]|nr:alpha-amylase family glycosyl hydrolase [Acidobacteriaceae bacterium]
MMEFHVSRKARERYQFNSTLFSFTGNVILGNLAASREFAHRINQARGAEKKPEEAVHPGALYAMGLIDELSHALVAFYRKQLDPKVMADALAWFEKRIGAKGLDKTLLAFIDRFPGSSVYNGTISSRQWLDGSTDGIPNRNLAFEEMMMLWLANANPAFKVFRELFADGGLAAASSYRSISLGLRDFFSTRPAIGPDKLNLIDMLRAPAMASPNSLSGQLAFIRKNWAAVLGDILDRIILALDVLKEEDLAIWMLFHPPSAGTLARRRRHADSWGTSSVPDYSDAAQEYERFSPDRDWMPTTVLMAKSTYVWLEQLSRKYHRHIHRLDQIPAQELELLAQRGMNALWLIGIWERSQASQTIKRLCGNQDAVASAYSLDGYAIAADLGGESAYRDLRDRAAAYGIRLASDMVPNHMGIDSGWVIEHPEWFLSRPDCPYPSYRFDGPDLSHDDRVEIKIEDHYYEQTDAAVVFRRRDKWTGDTRYVYHGNDGTSFPWNDTAQLDYLNPVTREQVIQTILHVARLFPIIRFDAAMTLAKKHVERLWYPIPGAGGSIPSRAEYSMSQAEFNAAMPHEFWREVVDRVAAEVPGTLLLAEAFWLMEGYFVRTLGMHRVYNSAFMNMLRDEDNAKYRSVIKNTLEFDPDILKRYVNFMSNPDERTAIDQFGRGDKCFGVATLMATLPGLPMFGHGQIEGFTEKYGMEFRRPRYDEQPDPSLVERHQRQIAPLLHRRWLFAESRDFLLYDFYRPDGFVDENVFAYSNQRGDQRALVVYHNRYASTFGTLHHSASYADKSAGHTRRRTIGEAFALSGDGNAILAFRDEVTGLTHLERSAKMASGGYSIHLDAYSCHVFVDWRTLWPEEDHRWDRLCDVLDGKGVPDLEEALFALEIAPVHDALVALLNSETLNLVAELASDPAAIEGCGDPGGPVTLLQKLEQHGLRFFSEAVRAYRRKWRDRAGDAADPAAMCREFCVQVRSLLELPSIEEQFSRPWPAEARAVLPSASPRVRANAVWGPALAWCILRTLGGVLSPAEGSAGASASSSSSALLAYDRLRLREALGRAFEQIGLHGEESWRAAARVRVALLNAAAPPALQKIAGYPAPLWEDSDLRWLIGVHQAPIPVTRPVTHNGGGGAPAEQQIEYFNKELHEELLWWIQLPRLAEIAERVRLKSAVPAVANTVRSAGRGERREKMRGPSSVPRVERSAIETMEEDVLSGLAQAGDAGYRTADLLAARKTSVTAPAASLSSKLASGKSIPAGKPKPRSPKR